MRRNSLILVVVLLILILTGCVSLRSLQKIIPIVRVEPTVGVQALPPYSGPKTRIAVDTFEVKVAKINGGIGSELRELLITALVNSNRFSIVERKELEPITKDEKSSTQKVEKRITITKKGLIILASATEFKPPSSGGRAGVGGGGSVDRGVLGSLSGDALNKAHLVLDISVIDASSSKIIATTSVRGQASDISGAIMAGFLGSWSLSGSLSAYANTPMEKAIRICIIEAVKFITEVTPASYYKY